MYCPSKPFDFSFKFRFESGLSLDGISQWLISGKSGILNREREYRYFWRFLYEYF